MGILMLALCIFFFYLGWEKRKRQREELSKKMLGDRSPFDASILHSADANSNSTSPAREKAPASIQDPRPDEKCYRNGYYSFYSSEDGALNVCHKVTDRMGSDPYEEYRFTPEMLRQLSQESFVQRFDGFLSGEHRQEARQALKEWLDRMGVAFNEAGEDKLQIGALEDLASATGPTAANPAPKNSEAKLHDGGFCYLCASTGSYRYSPTTDTFYSLTGNGHLEPVRQEDMPICYYILEPDTLCLFGNGSASAFEHFSRESNGYPIFRWEPEHEWNFYSTVLCFSPHIQLDFSFAPQYSVEVLPSARFRDYLLPDSHDTPERQDTLPSTEEIMARLRSENGAAARTKPGEQ